MRQNRPFVNLKDAQQILRNTFAEDGPRLVTIRADSGKGKSTLLSWFEDECRAHDIPCASLTFRELKSFDAFQVLRALSRKFKECGFEKYYKAMREHIQPSAVSVTLQNIAMESSEISGIQAIASDPVRRRYILAQMTECWFEDLDIFADRRVVLVLDAFEDANEEIKTWMEDAVQILRETTNVVLIVAGQKRPDVDAIRWADRCCELELPAELEYQFWREYAAGTGALTVLGENVLRQYHQKWRGDPKMMSLICDLEG